MYKKELKYCNVFLPNQNCQFDCQYAVVPTLKKIKILIVSKLAGKKLNRKSGVLFEIELEFCVLFCCNHIGTIVITNQYIYIGMIKKRQTTYLLNLRINILKLETRTSTEKKIT